MKKFTKNISLIVVLVLVCSMLVATMAACDTDAIHTHDYSSWKYDNTNHWKECPTDGAKDDSSIGAHTDGNGDGICDAGCGYDKMHVHSYSWKSNDTQHWKECSCGSKDDSTIGAHTDSNSDGVCDASCGYDKMHVHSYSWTYSDTQHWKECSCGAKEDGTLGAHVDANNDGICDTQCGYDAMHVHNYGAWSKDGVNHWKDCDSDNCQVKGSLGAHVDDNHDGKCDTCEGYILSNCEHYYVIDSENIVEPTADVEYDDWGFDIVGINGYIDGSAHINCNADGGCGIDMDIALKFTNFGTANMATVAPYECVYFYLYEDYTILFSMPEKSYVTIGDNTVLEIAMYKYTESYVDEFDETQYRSAWASDGTKLTNGRTVNFKNSSDDAYRVILFKAYSTDGNISFTLGDAPGTTKASAIEMEKNKVYADTVESSVAWYKYTATEDGEVVFYNEPAYTGWGEYGLEGDQVYWYTDDYDSEYFGAKYKVLSVTAGETYYFHTSYCSYSIKLMDKSPTSSYLGYSLDAPIVMDGNSITASNDLNGIKYYKWTAIADGTLALNVTSANAQMSCEYYTYDADYESWMAQDSYKVTNGMEIIIAVSYYSANNDGAYTIAPSIQTATKQDHTISVKDADGNAISGVTVAINGVSATTDVDGNAVLNITPGEYDIELSNYDSKYLYIAQSTEEGTLSYDITLLEEVTNTFKVTLGGSAKQGINVKVMDGDTIIAQGTTGADGTVTLSYAWGEIGTYSVVADLGDLGYVRNASSISKNANGTTITIRAYAYTVFTITVALDDGISIDKSGLSINFGDVATGTTNESGVATIKLNNTQVSDATDMSDWKIAVSITNLPAGYVASERIEWNDYDATITVKVDTSTPGTDPDPTPTGATLTLGDNEVEAEWYGEDEYVFTATASGTYTITLSDSIGDAVVYYKNSPILSSNEYESVLQYTFKLNAGESITFVISSDNYDACQEGTATHAYTLNIALTSEGTGSEGGEGGDGGETDIPDTFAFPAELIGTWYLNDGTPITITADSFVKGNQMLAQTGYDYAIDSTDGIKYTFKIGRANCSVYSSAGKWYFAEGSNALELLATDPTASVAFAFPANLVGTWYLSDGTEIVVRANSLSMDGVDCTNYEIVNEAGVNYYKFSGTTNSHGIYSDGSDWYFGTYMRGDLAEEEKLLATNPIGGEGGETSGGIPTAFIGTWCDADNTVEIVITAAGFDDGSGTTLTIANGDLKVTQNVDGTYSIEDTFGDGLLIKNNADGTITYSYPDYDEDWNPTTVTLILTKAA